MRFTSNEKALKGSFLAPLKKVFERFISDTFYDTKLFPTPPFSPFH